MSSAIWVINGENPATVHIGNSDFIMPQGYGVENLRDDFLIVGDFFVAFRRKFERFISNHFFGSEGSAALFVCNKEISGTMRLNSYVDTLPLLSLK